MKSKGRHHKHSIHQCEIQQKLRDLPDHEPPNQLPSKDLVGETLQGIRFSLQYSSKLVSPDCPFSLSWSLSVSTFTSALELFHKHNFLLFLSCFTYSFRKKAPCLSVLSLLSTASFLSCELRPLPRLLIFFLAPRFCCAFLFFHPLQRMEEVLHDQQFCPSGRAPERPLGPFQN